MAHISTILVCIAVTFSAWAFGGAETWAIYVLGGLSLVAFGVARWHPTTSRTAGLRGAGGGKVTGGHRFSVSAFLPFSFSLRPFSFSAFQYFSVSVFIFFLISILNPSHSYSVVDQGLTVLPHISWLPSTVSRVLTFNALLLLFSYFTIYWISSRIINRASFNILIGVIIVGAVCMAILALLQGSDNNSDLTGMFLNDNNFSSYINLVLPVVMGFARTLHKRAKSIHSRSNPAVLLYFCAGILAASVFFTGSRAGAVITMMILLAWLLLELNEVRRYRSKSRHNILHIILPVLSVLGLLIISGVGGWYDQLANPVTKLGSVVTSRWLAIGDTWQMFQDRFLYGVGAGSFRAAFPYYQDAGLSGFYRNAHNDWVQWLAELGIIGCIFCLVAVIASFRRCSNDRKELYLSKSVARGMWLGLFGVSMHAMIDFPFHIPAIAVIVAVWIGMLSHRPYGVFSSLKNRRSSSNIRRSKNRV